MNYSPSLNHERQNLIHALLDKIQPRITVANNGKTYPLVRIRHEINQYDVNQYDLSKESLEQVKTKLRLELSQRSTDQILRLDYRVPLENGYYRIETLGYHQCHDHIMTVTINTTLPGPQTNRDVYGSVGALCESIRERNMDGIRLALKSGADIHAQARRNLINPYEYPLFYSLNKAQPEVLNELIRHGIDVNRVSDHAMTTALIMMVHSRRQEAIVPCVRLLLQAHAELSCPEFVAKNVLFHMVDIASFIIHHAEIADYLLQHGHDAIMQRDDVFRNPLDQIEYITVEHSTANPGVRALNRMYEVFTILYDSARNRIRELLLFFLLSDLCMIVIEYL